jgi:hypothetical protein
MSVLSIAALPARAVSEDVAVPSSWEILPIPRFVDYGPRDELFPLGRVGIVRKEGGPYQTVRDERTELVGDSTITEEELARILEGLGVVVESVGDARSSYDGYDTVILLGAPRHNRRSAAAYEVLKLSFDRWDDPRTDEDDFTGWPDLGPEGYLLKVGKIGRQNVVLLAGYDLDKDGKFHGAGTFYALQSLRQLLVVKDGAPHVKTAEVADKPLVPFRGCYSGFSLDERLQWRDAAFMPRIKANINVQWYGNGMATYNAEAASKFRYPWRPDQLAFFSAVGKYCRERYVTMMFCMNPDHYNRDWAAPKAFDGKTKDPLHYDPNYKVEPEFKKMWADLGYEVDSDIDILAAKFSQMARAVPGAMLQIMNEDDVFGLVHEADKKYYGADTGDAKKDVEAYGRARAEVIVALYKRVRKLVPESSRYMPVCPPANIPYQLVLERDEQYSREFMTAMTGTMKEAGLLEYMPMLTTGGGTAPEVTTNQDMEDFKRWSGGAPVLLSYNNFSGGYHVGAYEMDPRGERSYLQIDPDLPAGYRDRGIYKRIWGFAWNGLMDERLLAWTQGQFMWNMLAGEREELNRLAARKVSTEKSYPLVKSLLEEFDNPASYLPDNQPPYRVKVVSDRVAFPSGGPGEHPAWVYNITYTDAMRLESQRLRNKLAHLVPLLEKHWEAPFQKKEILEGYAHNAAAFLSVYLANGYILGWEDATPADLLTKDALRDLYLEAAEVQDRFFAGPKGISARTYVDRDRWVGHLKFIYTGGQLKSPAATIAETEFHVDIWKKGLLEAFFDPVLTVTPAELPDDDPRLVTGWGKVEEAGGEKFRSASAVAYPVGRVCTPVLDVRSAARAQLLVRVRLGTAETDLNKGTPITLVTSGVAHDDVVCKPRWIYWLLPVGTSVSGIWLHAAMPVRVYAVEVYRQKG